MKWLLLFAMLVPVFGYSQPAKKDTKIVVSVTDTTNLFNRVALYLLEEGYSLESKDEQLGFLLTAERPFKNASASYKLRALIKGSTITLTGFSALDVEVKVMGVKAARTFDQAQYRTNKYHVDMAVWEKMEEVAKAFGAATYRQ